MGTAGRGWICRISVGAVADMGLALLLHDVSVWSGVRTGAPPLDDIGHGALRDSTDECEVEPIIEGRLDAGLPVAAMGSGLLSALLVADSMISKTS